MTAKFPTTLWDGASKSRKSIEIERAPDYNDWKQLVDEVMALEASLMGGSSSPVKINPGPLSGTDLNNNFLNVTGTLTPNNTITESGVRFVITSAGAGTLGQQAAFGVALNAGFTGPQLTYAIIASNAVAGVFVGKVNTITGSTGNNGITVSSTGTGLCNTAITGVARNGLTFNVGVSGISPTTGNNVTNIGVFGSGINAGTGTAVQIGGFFGLYVTGSADPVWESAALIADNGVTSSPVFLARVNNITKFGVRADGNIQSAMAVAGTTPGTVVKKIPIYDTAGVLLGYIPVYDAIT